MDLNKKYNQAISHLKQNQIDQAKKIFQQILRKKPKDIFSIEQLAKIYIDLKDYENANYYLDQLAIFTGSKEAFQNLIILNFDLNKLDRSKKYIDQLIQKDSDNLIAIIYKAKILIHEKKQMEAISIYEKYYDEFSGNKSYLMNYAFALNANERYKDAEEIYLQVLALDNNDFIAHFNLGIAYANQNKFDQAELAYKKTININKLFESAYLNLSSIYLRTNRFEESKNTVEELLKINHNNHIAHHTMGVLLTLNNQLNDSINYFKKALEINSTYTKSHHQLGLALLRMSNFEEFSQHYRWRTRDVDQIESCQMKFDDFDITNIDKNSNIVIYYEQGIGDQLFFSRFVNDLDVNKITLVVNKKIQRFLDNYLNYDVITPDQYNSDEYVDYLKINLASVLRYLPSEKICNKKDYKKISIQDVKNKNKLIVGISWRSRSDNYGDSKSFSIKKLLEKIYDDKIRFVNLQYGEINEEIDELSEQGYKVDIISEKNLTEDLSDLADVINECDLIITCSNVTAHMAGILNKKTYLLAPARYGRLWFWDADETNRSVWYPSIQIISNEENNWEIVFDELKRKLDNI
jgi:tetratricopeptide (TPR) repeat protein